MCRKTAAEGGVAVALAVIRTAMFYVVLMISMRLMGKRQLGDVEPAELVITMLISEVASMPLQDADVPVIRSIVIIAVLVCLEIIMSAVSMKSMFFRHFFQGRYSILVENGKMNQQEMFKLHLTVDELLEELRQNGAVSVDEVRLCVMETSGRMSVLLKEDTPPCSIPVSLVLNGKLIRQNFARAKVDKKAVDDFLKTRGVALSDVFWLASENGEFTLTQKEEAGG